MKESYIKKILQANVYDVAIESPLDFARCLSQKCGNQIWLKREDLQPIFSFKLRGAYNKISKLSAEQKKCGIITASAGNHAQGVALAAEKLALKAVIVMPVTTPEIKVASVRARGAEVVLHGDTFDVAYTHSLKLQAEHGYVYVHPYDDPDVIAGQGTIGMEIIRQSHEPIDAVFIPVGGGGLIAGMSAYIKYISPSTKVIGVEAEDSACLKAAMEAGKRIRLPTVGIFADGVAVQEMGKETFAVAIDCVDEVITATTDEICAAIKDIFEDTRSVAEPAGALAVAGLKNYVAKNNLKGACLVAIVSGANINFSRLRYICERTELGEKKEALLAVTIPEQPGSFRDFCHMLGKRNITEFNYRYSAKESAHVFVGVQMNNRTIELPALILDLQCQGYGVIDLSDNEMSKLHVRHLVGGRAPQNVDDEIIFRFEFPERPGALMDFLNGLGFRWNISLFHYRNQGSAFGRVLVGFQARKNQKEVREYLVSLDYPFWEETENPAYKLFLG